MNSTRPGAIHRQRNPHRAPRSRFVPTRHAAQRYVERFEGNLSESAATERLVALAGKARRTGGQPGGARVYRLQNLTLIVVDDLILTVYRRTK